jgi:hypothetical protein
MGVPPPVEKASRVEPVVFLPPYGSKARELKVVTTALVLTALFARAVEPFANSLRDAAAEAESNSPGGIGANLDGEPGTSGRVRNSPEAGAGVTCTIA